MSNEILPDSFQPESETESDYDNPKTPEQKDDPKTLNKKQVIQAMVLERS